MALPKPADHVEAALADALARAAAASEWSVVAQLARELEARRRRAKRDEPIQAGGRFGILPPTLDIRAWRNSCGGLLQRVQPSAAFVAKRRTEPQDRADGSRVIEHEVQG
jgi:hypothetical protein